MCCEVEMGRNKQLTGFFLMTHPALTYSGVHSEARKKDRSSGFSSHTELRHKLAKALLGQKRCILISSGFVHPLFSLPNLVADLQVRCDESLIGAVVICYSF